MPEKRCPQATARRVARALGRGQQVPDSEPRERGFGLVDLSDLQKQVRSAPGFAMYPLITLSQNSATATVSAGGRHQAKPPNKPGLLDQQVAGPYLFTPLEPFTHRVLHSRTVALRLFISAPGKQPALRSHIAD
ncbi:hypothetical protein E4U30_003265 [Claviceps sp. LM220 group G6]|nr:hypothetical protein E4U30_003265 [Claviceps sp. LM220 group G6]